MSVETNQLRSTRSVILAVRDALRALSLSLAGKSVKAFGRVEVFDLADWENAIASLVAAEDRVCFVIWIGDTFENQREISVLTTRRTTRVELLLSDFNVADPVASQLGDNHQPGVAGLSDAVLAGLTGVLMDEATGLDALALLPVALERITITDQDKQDIPGRHVISLTFDAVGQWTQVGIRDSEPYA
jgi:hypothetical protein